MEEKPRSVSQHALLYGVITGVVLIVFSLILFLVNLHMNKTLNYISYIFIIGGMLLCSLDYRKKYLNGYMSYGKAFTACFLVGLYAAILSGIYTYFFAQFIHPGLVQELIEQARENVMAANQNMSEEQLETALAYSTKFMSPPFLAIWGLIGTAIISTIISLILAIFIKKEDKTLMPSA